MADVLWVGPRRLHSRKARITSWTLGTLLGFFFIAVALPKLLGLQFEREMFEVWGYPLWFMYVVGVAEAAVAVFLFFPKTRFWGAALICLEMVGAALTHVQADQFAMLSLPGATFAAAFWLAWIDRPVLERYGGLTRRPAHA